MNKTYAFSRFCLTSGILAIPQSKSARSVCSVSSCVASRVYSMFWVLPSVTARRSSSGSAWSIPTANTVTPRGHTYTHQQICLTEQTDLWICICIVCRRTVNLMYVKYFPCFFSLFQFQIRCNCHRASDFRQFSVVKS